MNFYPAPPKKRDYDKEIKRLQAKQAAAIQAVEDAKRREMRRAFWLGQVVPFFCFLCLIAVLVTWFGR